MSQRIGWVMRRTETACSSGPRKASPGAARLGSEANSTLRAKLRRVTDHPRERQCGVCACRDTGPGIQATGKPGKWSTRWTGVLTCSHIWTCPVCTMRIRAERCSRVVRCLSNAAGRWQMATFTVRHAAYMPLRRTLKGLARAWRYTRQGGAIQALWARKVTASVRAFEVTHSRANGWHPHVHVLLRTSEWDDDEKAALLARWKLMVERELGGAECVPADELAIVWSDPIELCRGDELSENDHRRTRYLFKLGLEVAGSNKRSKRSRTSWQVAEDAGNGDPDSIELWREFAQVTKGMKMIALDRRAQAFSRNSMPAALDQNIAQPLDPSDTQCVDVSVDALELRAIREYERLKDPGILAVILADVAVSQCPETTVRRWIDLVTTALRYHGAHGERAPPPKDTS